MGHGRLFLRRRFLENTIFRGENMRLRPQVHEQLIFRGENMPLRPQVHRRTSEDGKTYGFTPSLL